MPSERDGSARPRGPAPEIRKGTRVAFWHYSDHSGPPVYVGTVRRVFPAGKAKNGDDVLPLAEVSFDGLRHARRVPLYCLEVVRDA